MMKCVQRYFLVVCGLTIAACTGDKPDGSATYAPPDSAGVRVIDLVPQDTLRIASTTGPIAGGDDLPIGALLDVRFVSDTAIAIADGFAKSVLLVNMSGESRFLGRSGRGPGEFTAVHFIQPDEAGLWVFDPMQLRLSYFDSTGTFARQRSEAPPKPEAGEFVMRFHVGLIDGHLVALGLPQREVATEGIAWARASVLVETNTGDYREVFAFRTARCAGDNPASCPPDQNYRNGQMLVGKQSLLILPGDRAEGLVLSDAGSVRALIRYPSPEQPFPEHAFLDQSDRVWLGTTGGQWLIVERTTGIVHSLELPVEVVPRDARGNRLALVRKDSLSVSTVEVATLAEH